MPVAAVDRPIDAVREQTIDQLILNYGHDKLSLAAFERRLEAALDATEASQMVELTADLDLQSDPTYAAKKRKHLFGVDAEQEADDAEYLITFMGGTERNGPWTVPSELRVLTFMGGTDIDFCDATFSNRVTRVKLACVMGGVDIKVPEGVNVSVKAFCFLGGVGNKARGRHDPDAPTLIIEGLVLLGGVDVKVKIQKKSTKERLLRFADDIRAMFDELGV
ncbi:MAG: DUF1707 and DUF2154 domain-containing protein [Gammaproteobacteria bacterium]|nr:DUF1707 and DUF2154 domain-containing protein [Gammaproteobacteria bacterium]